MTGHSASDGTHKYAQSARDPTKMGIASLDALGSHWKWMMLERRVVKDSGQADPPLYVSVRAPFESAGVELNRPSDTPPFPNVGS